MFSDPNRILFKSIPKTLHSCFDIHQIPYNLERVLYLLSGRDSALMREIYSRLTQTGKLILPPQLHQKVATITTQYLICTKKEKGD